MAKKKVLTWSLSRLEIFILIEMLFFYYDCIEGMILSRKKLRATLEWKIGKKSRNIKKMQNTIWGKTQNLVKDMFRCIIWTCCLRLFEGNVKHDL